MVGSKKKIVVAKCRLEFFLGRLGNVGWKKKIGWKFFLLSVGKCRSEEKMWGVKKKLAVGKCRLSEMSGKNVGCRKCRKKMSVAIFLSVGKCRLEKKMSV